MRFNKEAREAFPELRGFRSRRLEGQLPRPERCRDPHGNDGGRGADRAADEVREELVRLRSGLSGPAEAAPDESLRALLGEERWEQLDRFDRVQLADVVRVCQESSSLAAAGRELFAASRIRKRTANDSDRLRKYLAGFGLTWPDLKDRSANLVGADPAFRQSRTPRDER